jgi:hypothetical protein
MHYLKKSDMQLIILLQYGQVCNFIEPFHGFEMEISVSALKLNTRR